MTIITFKPGANTDDSFADSSGTLQDVASLEIGRLSDARRTFFRFPNFNIPKESTINSVTLTLRGNGARNDAIHIYIKAVAADNQLAPADRAALFALGLTVAVSALWEFTLATDTNFTSPSFASVIQEIVNRSGWVAGNALALVSYDNGATNDYGGVYSFNASSTYCATLEVDFTEPPGRMMQLPSFIG